MIELELPWPPTVNHYQGKQIIFPKSELVAQVFRDKDPAEAMKWLRARCRIQVYHKPEAEAFFYKTRFARGAKETIETDCHVSLQLSPPDARRRDADNVFKCLFDGLERSRCVVNDYQFRSGDWVRTDPVPNGRVIATITPMPEKQGTLDL